MPTAPKKASRVSYRERVRHVEESNDRDKWRRHPKKLVSVPTDAYRDGWERVFRKRSKRGK